MVFNFTKDGGLRADVSGQRLGSGGSESLADLPPGAEAVVESVDQSGSIGRRLLDLGFVPGTELKVVRRAPLGDPVEYELRGTRLCLRRTEGARIRVRRR